MRNFNWPLKILSYFEMYRAFPQLRFLRFLLSSLRCGSPVALWLAAMVSYEKRPLQARERLGLPVPRLAGGRPVWVPRTGVTERAIPWSVHRISSWWKLRGSRRVSVLRDSGEESGFQICRSGARA